MGSPTEVGRDLRRTPRGQLSYDSDCFRDKNSLEEILEEVEAQNRSLKEAVIASLSSVPPEVSSEMEEEAALPPLGMAVKEGVIGRAEPKECFIQKKLLISPRKRYPKELSPEFGSRRDAKRRSLERRILFDKFIQDEIREAEIQFRTKCQILWREREDVSRSYEKEEENEKERAAADAEALRLSKEEASLSRISLLHERISLAEQEIVSRTSPPSLKPPLKVEESPTLSLKKDVEAKGPPVLFPQDTTPLRLNEEKIVSSQEVNIPVLPLEDKIPTPPSDCNLPTFPKEELHGIKDPESLSPSSCEVSSANWALYKDAIKFLEEMRSRVSFSNKTLKFECKKAISTSINSICQVSKTHLKDKLSKLTSLCSGEPVSLGESKLVNPSDHPAGVEYCRFITAEKFVSHWDEQPNSIYALGAVMSALSSQFPDFGRLLVANFYKVCPFILPYYFARGTGESRRDYRTRCGYLDEDGEEEKSVVFLKRLGGVARLYAAYCIAELPQNLSDRKVNHGIGNLWRWLTSTLNLRPINEITPTLLCEVLEVSGNVLLETYKSNFVSLLTLLQVNYIPLIKEVTEEGCYGPVSRLEDFFDKWNKTSTIPPPDGALKAGFL